MGDENTEGWTWNPLVSSDQPCIVFLSYSNTFWRRSVSFLHFHVSLVQSYHNICFEELSPFPSWYVSTKDRICWDSFLLHSTNNECHHLLSFILTFLPLFFSWIRCWIRALEYALISQFVERYQLHPHLHPSNREHVEEVGKKEVGNRHWVSCEHWSEEEWVVFPMEIEPSLPNSNCYCWTSLNTDSNNHQTMLFIVVHLNFHFRHSFPSQKGPLYRS